MQRFGGLVLRGAGLALLSLLLVSACGDKTTAPVNHAPTITSVMVTPSQVAAGGTAMVTVAANDADGDQLTYSYQPSGGAIMGNTSTVSWTAPNAAGTYSVTVTVSDGQRTAVGSGQVTVNAGPVPGTGISGRISLPGGVQGDLRRMLVRLYNDFASYRANAPMLFVTARGDEYEVTFDFTNLPPGTYYLDAWKDMDADGNYTAGDVWSVYATGAWPNWTIAPVVVTAGNITNCSAGMVTFLL
jgi:hypothetical protein